jgi:AraC-like DNA-binding protein
MQSRLLLISTSKSISEIGNECTFPNTSHFIKLFKKEFGCTPAIYRSRHYQVIADEEQNPLVMASVRDSEVTHLDCVAL